MKIYIADGLAFAEISPNYLLYIGTAEEIERADAEKLDKLVHIAVIANQFETATIEGRVH